MIVAMLLLLAWSLGDWYNEVRDVDNDDDNDGTGGDSCTVVVP